MVDDMGRVEGFSLVEVVIVVLIVATLSAITIPVYGKYVARAQVASALSDIANGKSAVEYLVARGELSSLATTDSVGLYPTPHCSSITMDVDADGVVVLGCRLVGLAMVKNKFLRLERNASGTWVCNAAELDHAYRPAGCN